MADAHDGPISQGIRDAIRASDKTPYAIAKEVTRLGKVKLTGPQIYRFLNNQKGLSLAVLDEIARVLDVVVRLRSAEVSHVKETTPPQARRNRQSPHREIFQERLDRMEAIAAAEATNLDERITALDRAYNSIYRESLWTPGEIAILFKYLNELKTEVRKPPPSDPVRPVTYVNGIELTGDEDIEDIKYAFDYDQKKVTEYLAARRAERRSRPYVRKPPNLGGCKTRAFVEPPPDEFQARLDSLQLPDGLDETGINGKIGKLWERYFALVNEPGLTPSEIRRANDRHEIERKRINDEAGSWNPQEPDSSFQARLDSLRLPDGFEEGEDSWEPKVKRLDARYKAILSEGSLSPLHKRLVDARFEQERDRILKESMDNPEHGWIG